MVDLTVEAPAPFAQPQSKLPAMPNQWYATHGQRLFPTPPLQPPAIAQACDLLTRRLPLVPPPPPVPSMLPVLLAVPKHPAEEYDQNVV
jgi:hypothetical protein